ncbi:MAG: hypothetical protein ACTSRW_16945 [Candidatus Helarchaeota archaeon]
MKSVQEILYEIMKLYNKDPLDWHMSVNRDKFNNGNIFVSNPNHGVWQVKLDSLFKPRSLGVGMKIGNPDEASLVQRQSPSFGFRPLLSEQLERLKNDLLDKNPINALISDVLRNDPVPIEKTLRSPLSLQGPILFSNKPDFISDKQKELDRKLRNDLRRLLARNDQGQYYG